MKYIINTTYIVSPYMHGAWYEFMTTKFIPMLEQNEEYCSLRFTRLLSEQEEKHFTYSLQLDSPELSGYYHYMKTIMPEYVEFANTLFDAEATHFVSLLKVIK